MQSEEAAIPKKVAKRKPRAAKKSKAKVSPRRRAVPSPAPDGDPKDPKAGRLQLRVSKRFMDVVKKAAKVKKVTMTSFVMRAVTDAVRSDVESAKRRKAK